MTDPEFERACAVARGGITLVMLLWLLERIRASPKECQEFRAAWDAGRSYNLHATWNTVLGRYRSRRPG